MVSQQLVDQWRVRLAAWQQRLDEGRPRPWLARAYVRVFSFLLAQYAPTSVATQPHSTAPGGTEDEIDAHRDRSAMRFEAAAPELAGKPPRSADDIRSVLEAVKAKVPHVEQGPLADGLHPDDPIVVAAFYHLGFAAGLCEQLKAEGIESQARRFRRQTQILVCAADLERAKPIVASHAAFAQDSPEYHKEHVKAWSAKGLLIGFHFGAVIAFASVIAVLAVYGRNPDPVVGAVELIVLCSTIHLCGAIGALIGFVLAQLPDG